MNDMYFGFLKRFNKINKYYNYLIKQTRKNFYVGITNEWIIDNFYLLAELKTDIVRDRVEICKSIKDTKNLYYTLRQVAISNNYNIPFKVLVAELKKYQKDNKINLSYSKISAIKYLLEFIYIEKLYLLALDEEEKLLVKEKISKIIDTCNLDEVKLSTFTDNNFDVYNNKYYIYELSQQIKRLGNKSNYVFKEINELLESKNIGLKEIINDFHQEKISTNILISNVFGDLKRLLELSDEELFKNVSFTEKLLLMDKVYKSMTIESKVLYRRQITKLAKRKRCSEYELLEKLYGISLKEERHIGFYLFKEKNNILKTYIYLFVILILTLSISLFLSNYFIDFRWLGFLILLIPVNQLVIRIINTILVRIVPIDVLPKMDYSLGLPPEATTMVVIPTIISSTDKIKEMFDTLETFYLINKSSNLYFTLLGDVKESSKDVEDYDSKFSLYGESYAANLNKKYGKDLFYFVYRKRFFNDKENKYLGYERKRGALIQFNKILLGKVTPSFSKKNFFVNTLENKKLNIKYVITLDTDTRLVLSSALNLVGAMAHPLNKPILNKEGTKVISGYGLMQPRVDVDIESTNKSLYSQIFAGVGGFDTYSAFVPDLYQDLFREGSFIGKGIYDLEVFDKLLAETFPDNLILSHDLIEGNYLRVGYLADISLIDDFPSSFLTDVRRHHRWARGDVQIIGWLLNKVLNKKKEKVKNPINVLGKFKILDNIVRMFLFPTLLLILLLATNMKFSKSLLWIGFVILEVAISIIFFFGEKLTQKNEAKKVTVYYKNLLLGGRSLLYRAYITFITLPFYTVLYMDAFFRTLYRLFKTHKNLLNWVSSEEVSKNTDNSLKSYLRIFIPNYVVIILLIIVGLISNNFITYIMAFMFLTAPFILYLVSLDKTSNNKVSDNDLEQLEVLALDTWKYFYDNIKEEYHYLIPDNYEENREKKLDLRTSPTAIGYSLTSVISAYEMNFIELDEAFNLLGDILKSVDSLEKWNGHLYNWYNIENCQVLNPRFVSTVDSGNFIASVVIAREFLNKYENLELVKLCDKLINNANFKKLYTKRSVFSIGYDDNEGKLSIYNYNNFASEARLTSYLAICKGDVSVKHWFSLDKSLTMYKGHKGLISWSGTSFEYYMPFLFMKNYPNTLLDEAYQFAYFCQKSYIEKISKRLPWGISESAYNELDDALNYKYKAFSTPYLKMKEDKDKRIVISPYASIMALELFPKEVISNISKYKEMNMFDKYGLYESYDCDNETCVKAYFAHHQGMILMGLVNYLKEDSLKNYFHQNTLIKTFEILLKEKVQLRTDIDMKISDYKKYNYQKEEISNDIRTFNYISDMPEFSVLSNKKYCLLINDKGNGFSRYRTLQLNRYRKASEQDHGIYMYIRDLDTNYVWSNTYAPINKKSDNYEVVFASDKIKYLRTDGKIMTTTEIVVTPYHNAEIRKVTFKNNSDVSRTLELTTYMEVILSENMDDVSHRAFNNMFVSSEWDSKSNSLIMMRKGKGDSLVNNYMVSRLIVLDPMDKYSYETERSNFIGRGQMLNNPISISKKLSNYVGDNLDPISSIRNKIEIAANESREVYFIVGFGRSREQIREIINSYNTPRDINNTFKLASLNNVINTKSLNIKGEELRLYNIMLNYLYQTTKIALTEERLDLLRKNSLAQPGLWKFGISGDRPIILVDISDISDLPFVFSILKAFEYYKNNSIFVDVVIINNEGEYREVINKEIDDEIYRIYSVNSFYHTPGIIKVIDGGSLSREEISLFGIVPRLRFIIKDHITLEEAVLELQKKNKISDYEEKLYEKNSETSNLDKLEFDNGYGGFKNKGREYVIYNNKTPKPWSNVIANEEFGTIITNNGAGFTYFDNSSEFKITSWTNDLVVDDCSEGFKFNDLIFKPDSCVHGMGYSILKSESNDLKKEIIEFVSVNEPVKLYLVKLTNKTKWKKNIKVNFWINPTLGNFDEKTARHILSEFMEEDNFLRLRNAYSINYSDVYVYMSSSEKITKASYDKILIKSIENDIVLNGEEEKTLIFTLGANRSECIGEGLVRKYSDIEYALKAYEKVCEYWNDTLERVKIKSPDKSFDYMINGWYLYQTISSRIMAKAGFYQVSGAFGYRDQLQDAMNIVLVRPDMTRKQILINAEHQFIEGDVLHWWHEESKFGLRSRYMDDFLWLVYATINYIEVTGDSDILEVKVPYVTGDLLGTYEYEKTIYYNYSNNSDTLLKHCFKSLSLSMSNLGSHGLPLMNGGDWNDGMNRVGIKGKGESVWLGFFLYNIIDKFIDMIKDNKLNVDTLLYERFNEKLRDNLNKYGWDKDYYLRAYFDNGDKLGSRDNSECKIDLISQSFSIISSVASKERGLKVIEEVEKNLVDSDNGIIKLLNPAFKKSLNNPGYIMNYHEGIRENGGQYTHAVSWYIMALIKMGYREKAYQYYQMINPINRTLDKELVSKYNGEPYVIAADIYANKSFLGRAGWTWYTGSAGWFYNVALRDILGIKKFGKKLKIEPSFPDGWKEFKITYRFMDTVYKIEVHKDGKNETIVDGCIQKSHSIELINDKKTHDINIYRK